MIFLKNKKKNDNLMDVMENINDDFLWDQITEMKFGSLNKYKIKRRKSGE